MAGKSNRPDRSSKEEDVTDSPRQEPEDQNQQLRNSLRFTVDSAVRVWRQEQYALLEERSEQEVLDMISSVVVTPPVE